VGSVEVPHLNDRTPERPTAGTVTLRVEPLRTAAAAATVRADELELLEHGYEEVAAVVEDRATDLRDREKTWYLVRTSGPRPTRGWLPPEDAGRFRRLDELIRGLCFLTPNWNRILLRAPGTAWSDSLVDERDQPSASIAQVHWLTLLESRGVVSRGDHQRQHMFRSTGLPDRDRSRMGSRIRAKRQAQHLVLLKRMLSTATARKARGSNPGIHVNYAAKMSLRTIEAIERRS
jgi:hypothetical protein